MSTAGSRARICGILGVVVAYGCLTTPVAGAAPLAPEPCGLIKESEIAVAFGLARAIKHNTLVTAPGSPSGVVRTRCAAVAWRGPKPTNQKRRRRRLLEGRLARLGIQSWAPDEGPNAKLWRESFDDTLKRVRGAASSLFLTQLRGYRFLPPTFGAESAIGFSAAVGHIRRVRALWWSHNQKLLLVFDAVEARGQPTVAALKQVAAIVAGDFFRRSAPSV